MAIGNIAPIDTGPLITVAVEEVVVEEALDEDIVDIPELPILTDPDGGTWTVVFDGARTDVAATLNDELPDHRRSVG